MNYINFGQQNPSLIFQYLSTFEENHRNEANQNSITNAIFAAGIFSGFAGKDSPRVKAEDLLPFPDLVKGNDPKVFSPKTFSTIIRLMGQKRIPPPVLAFLHSLPEIQQKMIADGTK